jgi:multicomponent Na+:H+ antiporter subunit E
MGTARTGSGGLAARWAPVRLFSLALLWWLLADGDVSGWWLALPFILAAAWLAGPLRPRRVRLRLAGLLRFAAYFLVASFAAGWDVASRIFRPSLPIEPAFLRHELRQPDGHPGRLLFLATVSLLPGTLSTSAEGDVLLIHVLDRRLPLASALTRLEERVAGVFAPQG